jgi:hypothetical protein
MASDAAAPVWVEFKDEDGDSYFFNPATEETTRDQPAGVRLLSEAEYLSGAAGIAGSGEDTDDGHPDDWAEVMDDGAT